MSQDLKGGITIVDMLTAVSFATDQINRLKCQDPNILSKLCKNFDPNNQNTSCLQWKKNDYGRIWTTPEYVSDVKCNSDPDCKNQSLAKQCVGGYCYYKPDVQAGTCHIKDSDTCKSASNNWLPYKCNFDNTECQMKQTTKPATCTSDEDCGKCNKDGKCPGKCNKDGKCICSDKYSCSNKAICDDKGICQLSIIPNSDQYTEWRTEITCDDNMPCPSGLTCQDGKCLCSYDDDCPGSTKCTTNGTNKVCTGSTETNDSGRCVLGNWLLKRWCENPKARCQKDADGNIPPSCKGSSTEPGLTDVPPFYYNDKDGNCYIPPNYCKRYAKKYIEPNGCNETPTDPSFTKVDDPTYSDDGSKCIGPGSECHETTGSKVAQFFIGKTLYAMFSGQCHPEEQFTPNTTPMDSIFDQIPSIYKQFNSYPERSVVLADEREMTRTKIVIKNFAGPGIHLYMIMWKDETESIGFQSKEVHKVYPELIYKQKGKRVIVVNKSQIGKDKNLKRIYLMNNISKSFVKSFMKELSK